MLLDTLALPQALCFNLSLANGAAWVILDHCAETQVCLDATCVGEVPTSTASDATGDRDSDAGADAEPTEEDAQSEGDSERVSPEESESPEDPGE